MNYLLASPLFENLKLPVDVTVETFILTAGLIGLMMAAMASGVIFQGKELKGSCGGTKGGEDCFCDRNGLPRACELKDGQHQH